MPTTARTRTPRPDVLLERLLDHLLTGPQDDDTLSSAAVRLSALYGRRRCLRALRCILGKEKKA